MKKTVSLVQVNFQQGPVELNSFYLPYSIGMLWSYASSFEHIANNYELDHVLCFRNPTDITAERLATSNIVIFSAYVWNKSYNYQLAKKIKALNPQCILIFGGPEMPVTDPLIFEKLPFIDIVVKKEGEVVFKSILENLDNLDTVEGLLLNKELKVHDTGNSKRIDNLDILTSPYLSGFFDKLVQDNPQVEWCATLETNRGCPYQCTFCDWGSLIYSKVKKFDLERVYAELEWIGKNKCGFLFIADANFGIFPERDNLIMDKLIEVQGKYGYPYSVLCCWAKNQKEEVVAIASKMAKSKMNNGLTISVQTLNEQVLDIIKRKNLDQHKIEEIFEICEKNQMPVLTELILGLPGENLASWKDNIWKIINAGNHHGIDMYQAELLVNAELTLVQKEIYNIKGTTVYGYLGGSPEDEAQETIDVVTSTRDMSFDDMVEAQFFNSFIRTFHINGFSSIASRFLKKYKNVDYKDFYQEFYNYFYSDPWYKNTELEIKEYYTTWMTDGKLNPKKVGSIDIQGYNLMHLTMLKMYIENKHDAFFTMLSTFLDRYELDPVIKDNLIKFQKNFVLTYDKVKELPIQDTFDINVFDYILNGADLKFEPITYNFDFNVDKNVTPVMFLELVYFGRRRNFINAQVS